jgi:hypothetical protein
VNKGAATNGRNPNPGCADLLESSTVGQANIRIRFLSQLQYTSHHDEDETPLSLVRQKATKTKQ